VRREGLSQWKTSNSLSEVEPNTLLLVAQCLNQLHYRVPPQYKLRMIISTFAPNEVTVSKAVLFPYVRTYVSMYVYISYQRLYPLPNIQFARRPLSVLIVIFTPSDKGSVSQYLIIIIILLLLLLLLFCPLSFVVKRRVMSRNLLLHIIIFWLHLFMLRSFYFSPCLYITQGLENMELCTSDNQTTRVKLNAIIIIIY
jgi:hypothetical protein